MSTVLVTGGSGFIATHTIVQLLAAGHTVRTTVRNLKRESEVHAMIKEGGADAADARLSFFAADLMSDAGWAEAVAGCDYVLHLASPFPAGTPADENEIIRPAREGALRVLKASRDAGVKRVVLTSSFAAVGYGHKEQKDPFTEKDWTDLNSSHLSAYIRSKTIAEKAAWDFVDQEGKNLELSVINPVGVFGPILGLDFSTSIGLLKALFSGAMPGCPQLYFGVVDVRDVADLHIRAMTNPAAKGERFLCVAGDFMSIFQIAQILRKNLGNKADKVPARELPNWLVRLTAIFKPEVRQALPELGKKKNASNEKARRVLGWQPRSNEDAVLSTAQSLIKFGLLK